MKILSNYMKNHYGLIPLPNPSANIKPGAIMEGPRKSWTFSKIPVLTDVAIFANKVLNYKAGSVHRHDDDRIPANKEINKLDYQDVYQTIEIPETFNISVDSNASSFASSIKSSFSHLSGPLESQCESSRIAKIKITDSYKVTFADPDCKDTLTRELESEMAYNKATSKKVKYKYLITEVHYASGVDIQFGSKKRFSGKVSAKSELGAVDVPNAGVETSWTSDNTLRLRQTQDISEKQKIVLKLENEVQDLKNMVRRLEVSQKHNETKKMGQAVLDIEERVRKIEEDISELLNVRNLREGLNCIKDDLQVIKDGIADLHLHLGGDIEDSPFMDAVAMAEVEQEGAVPNLERGNTIKEDVEKSLKRDIQKLKRDVLQLESDVRKQADLGLTRIPFAVRGVLLRC